MDEPQRGAPTPAKPARSERSRGAAAPKSGRWKVGARLAVSVGVLTLLVLKTPHIGGVLPHHHHWHSALLLGAALLLTIGGVGLQAWRWQQVLRAFDQRVGIGTLFAYTLAGQFVGNVLPSTIGGDVVRVSRLGAAIDSTETAFGSVVIERLTGFVSLPALVVAGFLLKPSLRHVDHAAAEDAVDADDHFVGCHQQPTKVQRPPGAHTGRAVRKTETTRHHRPGPRSDRCPACR